MNREYEHEDLIDLGAVSVETKGGVFGTEDVGPSLIQAAGLNDE